MTDLIERISTKPEEIQKSDSSQINAGNGQPVQQPKPDNIVPIEETDLLNVPPLEASEPTPAVEPAAVSTPASEPTPTVEPVTEKRKRGRPLGSRNKPSFEDVNAIAQAVVDYNAMADATFDMSTGLASALIGPEWQAKSPEEKKVVCDALANYFRSKQMKDLPPGAMLAFVVVAYSLPRFGEQPTRTKAKLTWTWLKEKVRWLFSRKPKLSIVPPPIQPQP